MTKINGVCGPIDTEDLGFTLMHEHVVVSNWSMRMAFEDWLNVPEVVDEAVRKVREAAEAGVRTMVDLTPINLGRDIRLIREVAERAEAQIVAATGLYFQEEPWLVGWSADALVEWLLRDIEKGIQGTDARAGIIKCATDHAGVTPTNRKLLETAARLHRATGVPLSTHSVPENRSGLAQVEVFGEEGVDLSRVVIGHCGDTPDVGYLEEVLASGCTIGMDRFGLEGVLSTDERVSTIAELCRRGHAGRMVLSHDACCRIDWFPGGRPELVSKTWNWRHICNDVIPALRKEGVGEADIRAMTVGNPRRFFETTARGSY